MEADNDTAPACTCGGQWPAFVNCRGHIDGDDANGSPRRSDDIPVDWFDLDFYRFHGADDCGGSWTLARGPLTGPPEPVWRGDTDGRAGILRRCDPSVDDCDGAPA